MRILTTGRALTRNLQLTASFAPEGPPFCDGDYGACNRWRMRTKKCVENFNKSCKRAGLTQLFYRAKSYWSSGKGLPEGRGSIELFGLLLTLAAASAAGCASIPWEKRPVAAVMPFSYSANLPEHASSVSGLADALAGALLRTEKLRLVERQRMETVLSEVRLGATGVVDSKTATEVGRQLGAKLVILGSVVSISVREEGRSVKIAEKTDRWVEIEAEARLVDVETGELMATGRAFGKAHSAEKHAFGGKIGKLAEPEALVQKALQGMGEKLAKDLTKGVRA